MALENGITTDTFFNGRVKVNQSVRGYRFSIDAVLLASVTKTKPGEVVLDIGTGCGIIPILLAFRNPDVKVFGIEIQEALAIRAQDNVSANRMFDQISIINLDVRRLDNERIAGPVDWIVSNPPYREANSGRINPNSERAVARHEIQLTLRELIQACRRSLRTGGHFVTIYPCERLTDLICEMRSGGIEPKWMQCIHSRRDQEAKLVLVRGKMRGNSGLKLAPPLIIYEPDGSYTAAVTKMMMP